MFKKERFGEQENYIYYRGTIVGKRETTRSTSIRVAARKIPRQKPRDGKVSRTDVGGLTNYTDFLCAPELSGSLLVGDSVELCAHIRTGSKLRDDGGRDFFHTYVIDKIQKTDRILSEFYPELSGKGGNPDDENLVVLSGEVSGIYAPNETVSIITVGVPDGDTSYTNFCRAVGFRRQAKIIQGLQKGDRVALVGEISTENEGEGADRRVRASIIIRDIEKL